MTPVVWRRAFLAAFFAFLPLVAIFSSCTRAPESQSGRPTTTGEGVLGYIARADKIVLVSAAPAIKVTASAGAVSSSPEGSAPYVVTLLGLGANDLFNMANSTASEFQLADSVGKLGSALALPDGGFEIDVPGFTGPPPHSSLAVVVSSAPIVDRIIPLGRGVEGVNVAGRRIEGPVGFAPISGGDQSFRAHIHTCESNLDGDLRSDIRFGFPFIDVYSCSSPPLAGGTYLVGCAELRVKRVDFGTSCGTMSGSFTTADSEIEHSTVTGMAAYWGDRICVDQRISIQTVENGSPTGETSLDQSPPLEYCECDALGVCRSGIE